jgi:hypothetical protein
LEGLLQTLRRQIGGIMKVGDLVKHVFHSKQMGIVTEIDQNEFAIKVLWYDGDHSWTPARRMEVVDESR